MSAPTMAARWAAWWRLTRVEDRDEFAAAMHAQAGDDVQVTAQLATIAFADGSVYIERWTPPDCVDELFEPAAAAETPMRHCYKCGGAGGALICPVCGAPALPARIARDEDL